MTVLTGRSSGRLSGLLVDLDLLIINYVAIYPEFRGLRVAESAIHRTTDIFGAGCGLVACKPWPLQFSPSVAYDQEVLKRLALPNISNGVAIRKLRSYWSHLGFWPLGNTGIYLLSVSQSRDVSSRHRLKGLQYLELILYLLFRIASFHVEKMFPVF